MKEHVIMITERATITKWNVKKGDYVEKDDEILEFNLGYATVAVPSSISGKVVSITAKVGEIVEPGTVVGIVDPATIERAKEREKFLDYDEAIEIYEKLKLPEEAARVRKLRANMTSPKTEIHGDYVDDRDTIIKDSVLNRSNVGAGGKTKGERIKLIKELLDSGAIDDDEFKQMKKEILGK